MGDIKSHSLQAGCPYTYVFKLPDTDVLFESKIIFDKKEIKDNSTLKYISLQLFREQTSQYAVIMLHPLIFFVSVSSKFFTLEVLPVRKLLLKLP